MGRWTEWTKGRTEGVLLPLLLLCVLLHCCRCSDSAAVRHQVPDGENGTWYLVFSLIPGIDYIE